MNKNEEMEMNDIKWLENTVLDPKDVPSCVMVQEWLLVDAIFFAQRNEDVPFIYWCDTCQYWITNDLEGYPTCWCA